MDVLYLHQKIVKNCLLFLVIVADKPAEVIFTEELILIFRITSNG